MTCSHAPDPTGAQRVQAAKARAAGRECDARDLAHDDAFVVVARASSGVAARQWIRERGLTDAHAHPGGAVYRPKGAQ